jgi:CO dehydrogenase maturation factor
MYRIAVSGKGGSGKTTISALLVKTLLRRGIRPVLAVDADPAGCLAPALGMKPTITLGEIREQTRDAGNLPKSQFIEISLQQAVCEGEGFDLISMGRPEGPGCYCFVNNLLRETLERICEPYRAVIIDCEAGMEHISRRTAGKVDLLLLVSDVSLRGVKAAAEMVKIAQKLNNVPKEVIFLLNCTRQEDSFSGLIDEIRRLGFNEIFLIPFDERILELELKGGNFLHIENNSEAFLAVDLMVRDILGSN